MASRKKNKTYKEKEKKKTYLTQADQISGSRERRDDDRPMVQKLPPVTLLAQMSISAPCSTIVIVIERKDYRIECATVAGILI